MPGSKREFTYTLVPAPDDAGELGRRTKRILAWACDGDDRITCHEVTGDALGAVTLNLTIVGRDQWWCRQLAQDIVSLCTWALKNPAKLQLFSERLPPHDSRGYARGNRIKTWRESGGENL